jgi:hypothetical protein
MNEATSLPSAFAGLEPFVERWALGTTAERAARRRLMRSGKRSSPQLVPRWTPRWPTSMCCH